MANTVQLVKKKTNYNTKTKETEMNNLILVIGYDYDTKVTYIENTKHFSFCKKQIFKK